MAQRFVKYNPSFLETDQLIDNFVVRHTDLELIMGIIRDNVTNSNQHVLVIGPRGSGKTTLVLRVAAEIEKNRDLSENWYPLIFPEESYEVVSAGEFWLEALFHLAEQTGDEKWKRTYAELRNEVDDRRLEERALAQLRDFADSQGKRILLIVENLNMLFTDLISEDQAWNMRHALMNEPRLMLLATAVSRFENIENSSQAMFEMFKIHELKRLDEDECNNIWELITGKKLTDEQIRPITILTGGNPRLLTIIAKFSAHRSFGKLLDDLVDLIDDHTEYFKSHLDNLPAIERKVYLSLAELWNPSTAREIAKAARLDVNKTSSLLKRLVGRGAVIVAAQEKKTNWYAIAERMYNIYYLMRRRGKPADRVRATVKFMIALYDPVSAARLIFEEAGKLPPDRCGNYYLAYTEIIQELSDRQLAEKIIASTPKNFLESPYIDKALKNFMALEKKAERDALLSAGNIAESKEILKVIEPGFKLFQDGNYAQAIEELDIAIAKYSNSENVMAKYALAVAMLQKGLALISLRRLEDAITVLDELIGLYKDQIEPEFVEEIAMAMACKGVTLGNLNRMEDAIMVFDALIALYKDRPELQIAETVAMAMVCKGSTLSNLNRIEDAIKVYDEVIALYKNRFESQIAEAVTIAMVGRGVALERLSRVEEAISVYDDVFVRYKDHPEPQIAEAVAKAMIRKGVGFDNLGKYEEAENAFLQAIKLKPDLTGAHIQLIELLLGLPGRQEDALNLAEKIITSRPEDPSLLNAIARTVYRHGTSSSLPRAETWARRAVAISPDNLNMQRTLACILAILGNGKEALEYSNRYIQDANLVERSIEDAIELFVALAATGYAKEALGILENAPSRKHLEPLVVALRLYIGEDVKVAVEILEVAKDVVKRIEDRTQMRK